MPEVTHGWSADEALEQLYAAHWRRLVRLAVLLLRDQGAAEEVVQDSFVAMHSKWGRLHDPDKALAYLRQTVVNRSRSAPAPPHGRPAARRARAPAERRGRRRPHGVRRGAARHRARRAARTCPAASARCWPCATTSTSPRRRSPTSWGSAAARSRATPRAAPPRSEPSSAPPSRRPDDRRRPAAPAALRRGLRRRAPGPSRRDPCLRAPRPPGGTDVTTAALALRPLRRGRERCRDRRDRLHDQRPLGTRRRRHRPRGGRGHRQPVDRAGEHSDGHRLGSSFVSTGPRRRPRRSPPAPRRTPSTTWARTAPASRSSSASGTADPTSRPPTPRATAATS